MAYREVAQHHEHIACLWSRDAEPEARSHRILPDACVDIVWAGERLVVAGPATEARISTVPANTPAFGVRLAFGEMGDALLLSGQRVEPRVLQQSGFGFAYPTLDSALRHLLSVSSVAKFR